MGEGAVQTAPSIFPQGETDLASITPFVSVYLLFFGLTMGSFINLAADRLPRGESIIWPRSRCRACGRQLNTIDLLPVLGYVLRGGRCATCRGEIGVSSPIVEVIAGACMTGPVIWLGPWPGAIAGVGLVACWGLGVTSLAARRYANEARR